MSPFTTFDNAGSSSRPDREVDTRVSSTARGGPAGVRWAQSGSIEWNSMSSTVSQVARMDLVEEELVIRS